MVLKFWKYVLGCICAIPLTKLNVRSFLALSLETFISVLRYLSQQHVKGWHPERSEIIHPSPISVTICCSFGIGLSTDPGFLLSWAKGGDSVSERMVVTSLLICFSWALFVRYIRQGVINDVTVEKYNILQIMKVSWTYAFMLMEAILLLKVTVD